MCKQVIVLSYPRDGPAPDYRREVVPGRIRPKRDGSGALARGVMELCWVLVEVQTRAPVALSTRVA